MATQKKKAQKVRAKVEPKKEVDINDLKFHASGRKDEEALDKLQKLEKILGVGRVNPFGTNDSALFDRKLAEMNQADLKNLCMKVGIYPSGNRPQLVTRLKQEFRRKTKGASTLAMEINNPVLDPTTEEHRAAKKALGTPY